MNAAAYNRAVNETRSLLENWLQAGVPLFLHLKKVDDSGVWKHPGHATFGDFLRAEFPTALGLERYQNVMNAINVYGVDRVKQVGIASCHALTVKALVEDKEKRTLVCSGIDSFVKKNGCAPDRNKIRELVAAAAPETRKPPREFVDVQVGNDLRAAKVRIRELESEVRRLTKENEKLSAQVARVQANPKSRKASDVHASS